MFNAVAAVCNNFLFQGLIVVASLYFLRKYIKGGQFKDRVDATGKVAAVTGASSGIGKQIAGGLNRSGAKVYLLCRNYNKGQNAIKDLVKSGCDESRLLLRTIDLACFDSVRSFAASFIKEEERLDILVNNAGVFAVPSFQKTVDGYEKTFQSNYLGHFLLTELLMDLLYASGSARVINVSSVMHKNADSVDEDAVSNPKMYGRLQSYSRSKLANVMHVRSLTSRWREAGEYRITANACHPGAVYTNILQYTVFDVEPIKTMIKPILWYIFKTELDGAQTALYLALSDEVRDVSGKYFADCRQSKMAPIAEDDDACRKLYNYSLRAAHLA